MADAVSKALNKPQLRGLLHNQIRKNLIIAIGLCIGAGILQKVALNDARKNTYAKFYASYDIDKEFNTIRKKGLFDSCDAN